MPTAIIVKPNEMNDKKRYVEQGFAGIKINIDNIVFFPNLWEYSFKSCVNHALYGAVCTEARPACTSFIGSQKRSKIVQNRKIIPVKKIFL